MNKIVLGEDRASIEQIVGLSKGRTEIILSNQPLWRNQISASCDFLDQEWRAGNHIYGVTTGYGSCCNVEVTNELVKKLPRQLVRFHGCGLGKMFTRETGRAVMAVRLFSLSQGVSGVRLALLEQICKLLNLDIVPVIPEEGSVGASGDLTPLSYLAAVLCGERDVYYKQQIRPAGEVLGEVGIEALVLQPKEALALMNGTSVMTALACLAYDRAFYLAKLAARITALSLVALGGNKTHFSEKLFATKPHPGQTLAAAWIRSDIDDAQPVRQNFNKRFQERYSLRCAPHIIGVLLDTLSWVRQVTEIEINSANDNPLIDAESKTIMHGGHFYGGHIAIVMDTLKTAVANVADLLDRQLALLVDPDSNNGLPANLSGVTKEEAAINHGLKALQIGASAWTAEALKLTMPASVFSRSTESHNQDKVSMGTIAARDAIRVLELTEQTAAASLLAATQATELRVQQNQIKRNDLSNSLISALDQSRQQTQFLAEDRPLDSDLRRLLTCIEEQSWEIY